MQKLILTLSFIFLFADVRSQSQYQPGLLISYNLTGFKYNQIRKGFSIEPRVEIKVGKKRKKNYLRSGISLNYFYYSDDRGYCFTKESPNSIYYGPFKGGYIEKSITIIRSFNLPIEFKYKIFQIEQLAFFLFHGESTDFFTRTKNKQTMHYVDTLCNRTSDSFESISDWYQANDNFEFAIINGFSLEYLVNKHLVLQVESNYNFYITDDLDDNILKIGAGCKYIFD